MTTENPSTIAQLKRKLHKLKKEELENYATPEEWGTVELARHHARRLSVARITLLNCEHLVSGDDCDSLWKAIARVLQVEIFLRELGGEL